MRAIPPVHHQVKKKGFERTRRCEAQAGSGRRCGLSTNSREQVKEQEVAVLICRPEEQQQTRMSGGRTGKIRGKMSYLQAGMYVW